MQHEPGCWTWVRVAAVAWGVVIVGTCVHSLLRPERNTVYPIFAEAGRDWLVGGELYEQDAKPFRYSPAVAAFFAPFALLPDGVGGVVWRLLNAAALLAGLAVWARDLLPRSLMPTQRAVLFLLVLPLAAANLHNGQSNTLVLGLLLLGVGAAGRQRWNLAAVALGAATLFKLYPISVGLLLIVAAPRRLAGRFAVALVLGLALPLALQQPNYVAAQYAEWLHHLVGDHRHDLTPDLWYRDFRSLLLLVGVTVDESVWRIVQLGTAGLCAIAVRAGRLGLWRVLSLGCFWMTLFGPATEATTYLLLAPTAAWIVVDAWATRRRALVKALAVSGQALMMVSLIAVWFPFGRLALPQELRPAGAVLLFVAFLAVELPRLLPARRQRPDRLEGLLRLHYTVSVPTE